MLSPNLQSILDNRLRYLPPITGQAIMSVDWSTKIIDIGRRYGLHIDDIEELQNVILKSMTGLMSPIDFENNLISATAVSSATAEQMIDDINEQIFEPIHQFVISGEKKADPLTASGIIIEPVPLPELSSPRVPLPPSISQNPTERSTSGFSSVELEIPASPEPTVIKPNVSGNFDSFFMLK